jgi:hypothetical protein
MRAGARVECPVFARIAVSPPAELNKLNHLVSSFTICSESGRALRVVRANRYFCYDVKYLIQ